jgi:hypothetical protein
VKRIAPWSLGLLALAACSDNSPVAPGADVATDESALAASRQNGFVNVTNNDDDGKGSFRWAVAEANENPGIRRIEFRGKRRPIQLLTSVTYTGAQDLTLEGNNAIIDGASASGPAFIVTGGGDLKVSELTFRNSPAEGIDYEVPAAATGTIKVRLDRVTIADNKGHGVLVNDQVDPSTEDDVQPNAEGSAASLYVEVIGSSFLRNGYSVSDRDGLRVNEGGEGTLTFVARLSRSEDNAADGIELDERGVGDVRIDVSGLKLARNGKFDPLDFDDGFDIDEYDDGSILGTVSASSSLDNYEEGFDFNENNAGDFKVDMYLVNASGNAEEGIDYEEDDDFAGGGDLVTTMAGIVANRNGGDGGLKIREKGLGLLTANVTGVEANQNVVSGIAIREDADGTLTSNIVRARTVGNAAHGIDFDENSTGDLIATVSKSVSTGNTLFGIRADQQLPGTGSLLLTQVDLAGNTGGTVTGSNVTVTVGP